MTQKINGAIVIMESLCSGIGVVRGCQVACGCKYANGCPKLVILGEDAKEHVLEKGYALTPAEAEAVIQSLQPAFLQIGCPVRPDIAVLSAKSVEIINQARASAIPA